MITLQEAGHALAPFALGSRRFAGPFRVPPAAKPKPSWISDFEKPVKGRCCCSALACSAVRLIRGTIGIALEKGTETLFDAHDAKGIHTRPLG